MDKKKAEKFMSLALKLAAKGSGAVLPNPRVGAIVVKNGKIVGKGFHAFFGGKHAEAIALKNAGSRARGATLFVTLEPCTHFGKQPPCAPQVIESGVNEVFVASLDPNQKGKGIRQLKENGIKVHTGICEEAALELNKDFFKHAVTNKPFVLVKVALSLDGKITWGDGKRKQISGKKSTEKMHDLRKNFQAILVGKNTVLKDNPNLTSRDNEHTPIRIVVCSDALLPSHANVFSREAKTLVACTKKAKKKDIQKILATGAGVIVCKEKNGHVDLHNLLSQLGQAGIASIMVEAGQELFSSFLEEKLFDELVLIVSPRIIGAGKKFVKEGKSSGQLRLKKIERVEQDVWLWFGKKV